MNREKAQPMKTTRTQILMSEAFKFLAPALK